MVPDAGRLRADHPLLRQEPDAHRVHEAVLAVGLIEHAFPTDRGNAHAVPVVSNSSNGVAEQPALVRLRQLAKAQRIEQCHRSGAHRDDVPQNPADTGRRPLEGLDGARMIVAFHLERDRQAVSY